MGNPMRKPLYGRRPLSLKAGKAMIHTAFFSFAMLVLGCVMAWGPGGFFIALGITGLGAVAVGGICETITSVHRQS